MEITLASLFDGISGFPLAGQRTGITSKWSSEIEPFPLKVSAIRFPDMEQKGDITKLNGAELEPVDIITGGSPCQDLSVAGKRAGLAGERSGLFMEQIRIVREMRNADKCNGKAGEFIRPRFMVWENVPGAFSSNKGEDFRAVLEETARIADETVTIPRPAKGKWSTVGCIMGNGWSIAWRILDAQYWGVPQRRRRIFLVADFGGQSAPEILFKREGLSRHIAESREAREGIAVDVERGTGEASNCINPWDSQGHRVFTDTGAFPCLRGNCETSGGYPSAMIATKAYGICSDASNSMKSNNPHSGIYEANTSRTLDQNGGSPACNQGGIAIVQAAGFCPEQSAKTRGIGYEEEISPTLRKDVTPAVCKAIGFSGKNSATLNLCPSEELSPTLRSKAETHVAVLPFNATQITSPQNGNNPQYGDPCHPLCATDYAPYIVEKTINCQPSGISGTVSSKWATGSGGPAGDECYNLVCSVDCRNMYENPEKSATLQSKSNGGQSLNYQNPVRIGYSVRRLTPLECERLQDYPDGWTDIPGASDSGRYKAEGNSVAVCCPEYVLEGIKEVLEVHHEI